MKIYNKNKDIKFSSDVQCFVGVGDQRLTAVRVSVVKAPCLIGPFLFRIEYCSSSLIWQEDSFYILEGLFCILLLQIAKLLINLSEKNLNEAFQSVTVKHLNSRNHILSFYSVCDSTKCFSRNLLNNLIQWRRPHSTLIWRNVGYFWYRFWS